MLTQWTYLELTKTTGIQAADKQCRTQVLVTDPESPHRQIATLKQQQGCILKT
jgi:hypothetical protein